MKPTAPPVLFLLKHWHEADCPKPDGGECTCPNGPDIALVPCWTESELEEAVSLKWEDLPEDVRKGGE